MFHEQRISFGMTELMQNTDYYLNLQGQMVFTQLYLLKRGTCCENNCRHCPYGFEPEHKMKKIIHRADTRGFADHGWLKSRHTFSFAAYQNPNRMGFGKLRVLNDDVIAGGSGFGTHAHQNMEIVSIPISGVLRHKDSMGNEQIISQGEIQRMSAGSGVTHSEYNNSKTEAANFLQIWILPQEENITPGYGQKRFAPKDRQNKLQLIIAPTEEGGAISINQDAYFSLADLDAGKGVTYKINAPEHGIYVFVIDGEIGVADEILKKRDAIGINNVTSLEIKSLQNAQVLVMEVALLGS